MFLANTKMGGIGQECILGRYCVSSQNSLSGTKGRRKSQKCVNIVLVVFQTRCLFGMNGTEPQNSA
jgi:hypothetical protein